MLNTTKPILQSGNAGIAQLASDLRHDMPEGFIWDFLTTLIVGNTPETLQYFKEKYGPNCNSIGCAMGFAQIYYSNIPNKEKLNEILQMPEEDFYNIFWNDRCYNKDIEEIFPLDVAQKLEEYLLCASI